MLARVNVASPRSHHHFLNKNQARKGNVISVLGPLCIERGQAQNPHDCVDNSLHTACDVFRRAHTYSAWKNIRALSTAGAGAWQPGCRMPNPNLSAQQNQKPHSKLNMGPAGWSNRTGGGAMTCWKYQYDEDFGTSAHGRCLERHDLSRDGTCTFLNPLHNTTQ